MIKKQLCKNILLIHLKDVFATFKILHIPLQNNHTTYHPTKPNKFASALALHYLCKKITTY